MATKTRDEIVQECANMVKGCFDYYSDELLDKSIVTQIGQHLSLVLPKNVTMVEWQKFADEYDARVAAEEENEQCEARIEGEISVSCREWQENFDTEGEQ